MVFLKVGGMILESPNQGHKSDIRRSVHGVVPIAFYGYDFFLNGLRKLMNRETVSLLLSSDPICPVASCGPDYSSGQNEEQLANEFKKQTAQGALNRKHEAGRRFGS